MPRKTGDPRRGICLIRTSTDQQDLSPAAQRKAMDSWAKAHGVDLVAVYTEKGVSGGTPLEKRLVLLEAIDAITQHAAGVFLVARRGVFLVARRDRLARDVVAAAMVTRLIEKHGAKVLAADGVGNGEGPEAALLAGLVDLFAQYERATIRFRTKSALAVKAARGEKLGGSVPYGFRVGRSGNVKILKPDLREAATVARIVRLRRRGRSLRAIAGTLEHQGIRTKTGRPHWSAEAVRSILDRAQRSSTAG